VFLYPLLDHSLPGFAAHLQQDGSLRPLAGAVSLSLLLAAGLASCGIWAESDPEGEAWSEFREYLRGRQTCVVDEDCEVVEVKCPLGCSYGVNAKYAAAARRKAADLAEGFECTKCTHGDAASCHLLCSEGKCLSPYESRCGQLVPDAGR
jgi:hypothetical protein